MISFMTINASCRDLSASSTTLCEPPRTRILTAFGFLHPSINTHLSVSTLRSSTRSAEPRSFGTKSSRLRSEEHTSELQSRGHLVCRLLLEKKKKNQTSQ